MLHVHRLLRKDLHELGIDNLLGNPDDIYERGHSGQ